MEKSNIKLGDYFLDITSDYGGDIEQIVEIKNDKYYFKTIKNISGTCFPRSESTSLQQIKNRCEKGVWKRLSNLQVKVLTGEIK